MTQWFVVNTRPRQEQVALDNLQRQGYRAYLHTAEGIEQKAVLMKKSCSEKSRNAQLWNRRLGC